jgi:hypothetical protein
MTNRVRPDNVRNSQKAAPRQGLYKHTQIEVGADMIQARFHVSEGY